MTAWVVRALLAGALLSLAALAADRAAGWLGRPRRWVWATAMAASLLLPLIAHWLPGVFPTLPFDAPAETGGALSWLGAAPAPVAVPLPAAPFAAEHQLELAWLAASLAMLAAIGWTCVRLRALRRRCVPAVVDGFAVLLSGRDGPVVLGLLRPAIVLPRWVLAAPAEERALILRHEREHVAAGDAWLLFLGTLAVAFMPWNPALWWQHRRLRLGTEIDCDARVLLHGASRRAYGAVLLSTAGAPLSILAPAWGEAKSHLERRIIAMTMRQTTHPALRSAILGIAALCTGAAACDVAGGRAVAPTAAARGVWDGATLEQVSVGTGPTKRFGLVYSYAMDGQIRGNGRPVPLRMPHHAVVARVVDGSPVQAAGLQAGDTILSVNGRDGREKKLFPNRSPGASYDLRIRRKGQIHDVSFAVGSPEDYPESPR